MFSYSVQHRASRSWPARYCRISMLALALGGAVGMLVTSTAAAQSTTAGIYGSAPAAAGATVTVQSDSGFTRTATVDADGRYAIGNLPVGTYTVTLQRPGQPAETRQNIALRVGAGTDVSFGSNNGSADTSTLGTITVTGQNIPPVDVSATASRTVITAEQLQRLPLARSGEAIALLSPGAVQGSGYFGNAISFGGASVSENAYYLNGYLSSDPLTNIGGVSLPYGAIDQQETYTGGYSARYGRSAGGVLSQVGKRGTNEWHFGGQALWKPKSLSSDYKNVFYPDTPLPSSDYAYTKPDLPGTLYRSRKGDKAWNTVYSAYAGGPLIEDRLFVFVAAEQERTEGVSTASRESSVIGRDTYRVDEPKVYAKVDWNINDNNILEFTGVKNNYRASGAYSDFSYPGLIAPSASGAFADTVKVDDRYYIGKYTSYLTDTLTFSATYGKSRQLDYRNNPSLAPYLYNTNQQDTAITFGGEIRNNQTSTQATDGENRTRGLRLDLEYVLGSHTLAGGVDNMFFNANNEGDLTTGPGYTWRYGQLDPDKPINETLGVGPAGGDGYYVYRGVFETATSMSVRQKAYFLEDKWQINDRLLLILGVRNDKFTNFNDAGKVYVQSGDQWAPRLGVSWDAFGDSSLKVYGNAGRYYLALPNSVAIRGASPSTYTREYFTYSGIDAEGNPTGLTPIPVDPSAGHVCYGNVVSANRECGQQPDVASVAATNLKSMYQDEFMVGFDKTLGNEWVTGAKFTYRTLGAAIDDVCDADKMRTKLAAIGVNPSAVDVPGCVIFNPGETNSFSVANLDGSGRTAVSMSSADWGFDKKAKRKYLALDLFLQHPFDGTWEGRIDYTVSRNFGNTEGQVKSDIGQSDVSKTQDWDAAALMWYSGGDLANDRRHQIKLYGSYQIAPEWLLAGNIRILSGTPKSCLGYVSINGTDEYSAAGDPVAYGSAYHTCGGRPSRPGDAGRLPWTKIVDLGLTYRPSFAGNKLAFTLQGFNIFNERKPLQVNSTWEGDPYKLSNVYGMGISFTQPRYAVLSMSYDY